MLGAALLHASWNVIIKSGGNPLYEITLNTIGAGLGALCLLPFVSLPAAASLPFLMGSITVHFTYALCIASAYKYGDLSYAYTIMRGSAPMLTAILLAFLGQAMGLLDWLAVVLLSLGVMTLTLDAIRTGRFHLKGTIIAFGTALVIMGYTVVDGYGTRQSQSPLGYVCLLFLANAFPMSIFVSLRYKHDFFTYCKSRAHIGMFGGLCSLASYGIALWAMTKAPIALVAALRETSVIFGMLLAVIFLKEQFTFARGIAIALVAAGMICMRLV